MGDKQRRNTPKSPASDRPPSPSSAGPGRQGGGGSGGEVMDVQGAPGGGNRAARDIVDAEQGQGTGGEREGSAGLDHGGGGIAPDGPPPGGQPPGAEAGEQAPGAPDPVVDQAGGAGSGAPPPGGGTPGGGGDAGGGGSQSEGAGGARQVAGSGGQEQSVGSEQAAGPGEAQGPGASPGEQSAGGEQGSGGEQGPRGEQAEGEQGGSGEIGQQRAPGGGEEASEDGPSPEASTGDESIDDFLDAHADDSTVAELSEEATPWYDHPMVRAGENVVERLIPVYGAYDAVRDNWNRHGDMVEMAPPILESPGSAIMHFTMTFANMAQGIAGVLRHVAYLASICQWLSTISIIADGPLGAIIAAIAALGGEVLTFFTGFFELLAMAGNLLTTVVAVINALATDDPTNRLRYMNIAGMATEGMLLNLVNLVMDAVAFFSLNFIPSAATATVVRKVAEPMVKTGVRFAIGGLAKWGLQGLYAEDEEFEYGELPRDEQGRPMKTYEWPHLSEGLFREGWFFHEEESDAVVLNAWTDSASDASSGSASLVAPIFEQDSRAGGAPGAGGQALPEVDHSPAQVQALAGLSSGLGEILGDRRETRAAAEEHKRAHSENLELAARGEEQIDAEEAERQGMVEQAASAQASLQEGVGSVEGGQAEVSTVMGQVGGASSLLGEVASIQAPSAPPSEDQGLLEQAVDWLSEQALDAAFSRLGGATDQATGAASGEQATAQSAQGEAGAVLGDMSALMTQIQEAMSIDQQVGADSQAALAGLSTQRGQLQEARATSQQEIAMADEQIAQEDADIEELQALIDEVDEERERQEQANEAFAAQYGEQIAAGEVDGVPVTDSDAQMLLEAFDAVQGLSDGAVSEAAARAAGLPDGASAAADDLVSRFQGQQEQAMAETMTLVGAAVGQAGSSGADAWAAVDAARQAVADAEVTTRMARGRVLAQLDALMEQAAERGEAEPAAPARASAAAES